jgi:hypothetical protein
MVFLYKAAIEACLEDDCAIYWKGNHLLSVAYAVEYVQIKGNKIISKNSVFYTIPFLRSCKIAMVSSTFEYGVYFQKATFVLYTRHLLILYVQSLYILKKITALIMTHRSDKENSFYNLLHINDKTT